MGQNFPITFYQIRVWHEKTLKYQNSRWPWSTYFEMFLSSLFQKPACWMVCNFSIDFMQKIRHQRQPVHFCHTTFISKVRKGKNLSGWLTSVILRGAASWSERWIGFHRLVRKLRSLLCTPQHLAHLTRRRNRRVWKDGIGWVLWLGYGGNPLHE